MDRINVREAAAIYDTVILCNEFYGTEDQNRGWFDSVDAFGQQTSHSFFSLRTEATAGLAYCNKQSADSMDFPFEAYSIGCAFAAPGVRTLGNNADVATWTYLQSQFAHWWETVLPRHCSLELKVQQDTILELPSLAASPGYGPSGGGASFAHDDLGYSAPNGTANAGYYPVMNFAMTQGVPTLKNRFPLGKKPVGIPRTGTVEAIVTISDIARYEMQQFVDCEMYYMFPTDTPTEFSKHPARLEIQVSLLGQRLVQQRGQWFA